MCVREEIALTRLLEHRFVWDLVDPQHFICCPKFVYKACGCGTFKQIEKGTMETLGLVWKEYISSYVLRRWFCCCWLIVICCSWLLVLALLCSTIWFVLSSVSIYSLRKRKLVVWLFCRYVPVRVLCLFLTHAVFGLWSVIVAFPGHTHLLKD